MYDLTPAQLRDSFWKTFGRYMAPVPSASGEKMNWVNYKTGVKAVRFIMEIHDQQAVVSVIVSDAEMFHDAFLPLKKLFVNEAGQHWIWEEGKIYSTLTGVNIHRSEDWPRLISFLKERMIALDNFWEQVKDSF